MGHKKEEFDENAPRSQLACSTHHRPDTHHRGRWAVLSRRQRAISLHDCSWRVGPVAGQGIYFHDTLFTASLSWGTDLVTLFICLPLLALAAWLTSAVMRGGILYTQFCANRTKIMNSPDRPTATVAKGQTPSHRRRLPRRMQRSLHFDQAVTLEEQASRKHKTSSVSGGAEFGVRCPRTSTRRPGQRLWRHR